MADIESIDNQIKVLQTKRDEIIKRRRSEMIRVKRLHNITGSEYRVVFGVAEIMTLDPSDVNDDSVIYINEVKHYFMSVDLEKVYRDELYKAEFIIPYKVRCASISRTIWVCLYVRTLTGDEYLGSEDCIKQYISYRDGIDHSRIELNQIGDKGWHRLMNILTPVENPIDVRVIFKRGDEIIVHPMHLGEETSVFYLANRVMADILDIDTNMSNIYWSIRKVFDGSEDDYISELEVCEDGMVYLIDVRPSTRRIRSANVTCRRPKRKRLGVISITSSSSEDSDEYE